MIVQKTSPTIFELKSDNLCVALAGYAVETMGACGVYIWRSELISKEDAEAAFAADPSVKAAIAQRQRINQPKVVA